MNFINSILQQISGISKSRKKFMIILFKTMLAVPGKINFRNLSRFCDLSEKTFSRNFRKAFCFMQLNLLLIKSIYRKSTDLILAVDCSFIDKSGKKTYGLGRFFNGSNSRAEKGLEIFLASIVDPIITQLFRFWLIKHRQICITVTQGQTKIFMMRPELISIWNALIIHITK